MGSGSNLPLAVITGANRGLGLGTARALAERSHRLFLTCRGQKESVALARELRAEVFVADVCDPDGIAAMARRLSDAYGRVDVLVNNAGIDPDRGRHWDDIPGGVEGELDLMRRTWETNFAGAYRVTRSLMPLLRKSRAPRIVNVSSGLGMLHAMAGGSVGYRTSKAALNALTGIWADELRDLPAKVNSVSPGWVRTDMGGPDANRSVEEGVAGIVWACTLPADGPTGGFFRDGSPIGW